VRNTKIESQKRNNEETKENPGENTT